jgi:hypothetical protein
MHNRTRHAPIDIHTRLDPRTPEILAVAGAPMLARSRGEHLDANVS